MKQDDKYLYLEEALTSQERKDINKLKKGIIEVLRKAKLDGGEANADCLRNGFTYLNTVVEERMKQQKVSIRHQMRYHLKWDELRFFEYLHKMWEKPQFREQADMEDEMTYGLNTHEN